jgi:hypothetical protein
MERCWYFVIENRGKWWVESEGSYLGPFDATREAVEGAIRLAEIYGDPAKRLLILSPDSTGHIQIVWERNPREP